MDMSEFPVPVIIHITYPVLGYGDGMLTEETRWAKDHQGQASPRHSPAQHRACSPAPLGISHLYWAANPSWPGLTGLRICAPQLPKLRVGCVVHLANANPGPADQLDLLVACGVCP